MIRRPPRSTPLYSSAASDVYKRQDYIHGKITRKITDWRLCSACPRTGRVRLGSERDFLVQVSRLPNRISASREPLHVYRTARIAGHADAAKWQLANRGSTAPTGSRDKFPDVRRFRSCLL